jgi:hypothetical protein
VQHEPSRGCCVRAELPHRPREMVGADRLRRRVDARKAPAHLEVPRRPDPFPDPISDPAHATSWRRGVASVSRRRGSRQQKQRLAVTNLRIVRLAAPMTCLALQPLDKHFFTCAPTGASGRRCRMLRDKLSAISGAGVLVAAQRLAAHPQLVVRVRDYGWSGRHAASIPMPLPVNRDRVPDRPGKPSRSGQGPQSWKDSDLDLMTTERPTRIVLVSGRPQSIRGNR